MDIFAKTAVMFVGEIAEAEEHIAQVVQTAGLVDGREGFPEGGGIIWRLALVVSRDDEDGERLFLEVLDLALIDDTVRSFTLTGLHQIPFSPASWVISLANRSAVLV